MTETLDIDTPKAKGRISIIAAISKDRGVGLKGKLLWSLPDDMMHFRAVTAGHPVIMGRKTWESLPERFRPLPGRANIVVTRQTGYEAIGATVVNSLEEARAAAASPSDSVALGARAPGADEIFVIGGGELYREALPFADRLYLTLVDATALADTYFPEYEQDFKTISDTPGEGEPAHRFLILE